MLKLLGSFIRRPSQRGGVITAAPSALEESMGMEAASKPAVKQQAVAGELSPQPTPKVKNKAAALASYLTTTRQGDFPLPSSDRRLASTDITDYRTGASTTDIIRNFAAASPDLAAAVFAYLRIAITASHRAIAKNPDGSFNPDATSLLQQIITRMDVVPNYMDGFGGSYSIRSVAESLGKELLYHGGMSCELVLDKARTPWRIQPLHVGHIKWIPDGNDLKPQQWLAGEKIDLDIPTFFYVALDQDLLTAYASSPLEPAIKPTIFSEDFQNDLWKVVKRAIHPRQHVKIIWEKLRDQIPAEAQHDTDELNKWLNGVIEDVTNKVNTLGVDEALVYFDFFEVERETNGNISLSQEWTTLSDILNAKLATGAKTMPAILGHGVGSSNVASTESMLFVKAAAGAVQEKLNEIFSRVFTLAVRLYGYDVAVEFRYDTVDLRPDVELESFKTQKQSRVLELLSLGLISDEEASIELTGRLPPVGYKALTGTMFMSKKPDTTNGYDGATNNGSTLNQNLTPDTPQGGGRGSNTKSSPTKAGVVEFTPKKGS